MELAEKKVSKIWDHPEDVQEAYNKWWTEVEEAKTKNEQIRKLTKKRRSKTMRLLMKEKSLRLKASEREMLKLNELKEQMLNEEHESYYRKLMKTCEELSKNGSGNFLKVKKRIERKKAEGVHAVRNKDGKLVTDNDGILTCYQ